MLLNLSNHPVSKWESVQKDAAAVYGEIVDFPFPEINPEWDTEIVEECARRFFKMCVDRIGGQKEESAVHLAGEPIFCFMLAQLLLRNGYVCLTSTTQRTVVECGDIKQSIFRFKKFRKYKLIADETHRINQETS